MRRAGSLPILRLVLLILALGGLALFAWRTELFGLGRPAELVRRIRELRDVPGIPALFVLAYAAATAVGLPGSALTLAGGAIFGVWTGSVLNWLGATLGAILAYALARWLGREGVRRLLGRHATALDRVATRHGFLGVLRLRLIPIVPFNALNFGAGLAGVRARHYVAATALGIVPGTVVYTYFADALLGGVEGAGQRAFLNLLVAGVLLILLSFLPTLVGWSRRRPDAEPAP